MSDYLRARELGHRGEARPRWWPFSEPPQHRRNDNVPHDGTRARHKLERVVGCPACQPTLYALHWSRHKAEETA